MTLEEFQPTGRDVEDLTQHPVAGPQLATEGPIPGRMYLDGYFIERPAPGLWRV